MFLRELPLLAAMGLGAACSERASGEIPPAQESARPSEDWDQSVLRTDEPLVIYETQGPDRDYKLIVRNASEAPFSEMVVTIELGPSGVRESSLKGGGALEEVRPKAERCKVTVRETTAEQGAVMWLVREAGDAPKNE